MRKSLILAIALAMVLVSGGMFSAQAGSCLPNLSPCNWHFPSMCGIGCSSKDVNSAPVSNADRPEIICQGAYSSGPAVPAQLGGLGGL